ncbi:Hypothetical predicted protein [Paramuricea clavata]|uniref:Uncharacterized protein n=1 Tax=Paramuricea clavata TaxID=317549 RepID=A0A6S7JM49_PARCT|nr:Hypothetical predicted protein [Paramuricea clavata]
MLNSKTNVIKLNVWIESVNDTMTLMNKTRVLTDMHWANEIGRTLYSLILETRNLQSLISFLPEVTLTTGFHDVNIVVFEENEKCLLSENNTLDHAIFDLLLRQLYRVSDDNTDYQLCRIHNLALNCCGISRDKHIRICSYYSSFVAHLYPIITVTVFSLYLAFPLIVDYLSRFKDSDYYTISDSPMALSYIFHMIFIEGRGPVIKSFTRKLLIVILVFVICLPIRNIGLTIWTIFWYIFLGLWMFPFMIFDIYGTRKFQSDHFALNVFGKSALEVITWPFSLTLLWEKVCQQWPSFNIKDFTKKLNLKSKSTERKEYVALIKLPNRESTTMTEHTELLNRAESTEITEPTRSSKPQVQQHSPQHHPKRVEIWKYRIKFFILFFVYLVIAFPFSCCLALLYFFKCIWTFCTRTNSSSHWTKIKNLLRFIYGVIVFGLLAYSSMSVFGSSLLFIIGLFLNGETFINYFLPLSTILFYSWTNWKSSVETKYLVLITTIYEVCKESTPVQSTALANSGRERNENATPVQSGVEKYENANDAETKPGIKLNDDGEPIILKTLYDKVRKKFLPYHRILFYYFLGIFFVTVFAYFLYTMMSLSEKSGITSSVQIIASMAATTLPIIFDFVWTKNSDEQKATNAIALKSKLKRVLKVHSSNETSGEIKVEVIE